METGLIGVMILAVFYHVDVSRLSCSLDGLSSLSNLTILDLSACGLSHVHLTPGCVGQLRHLSLGHNTFGGDSGVALATYLTWCTTLEHLSLIDCSLDHMTSSSLWQAIASVFLSITENLATLSFDV